MLDNGQKRLQWFTACIYSVDYASVGLEALEPSTMVGAFDCKSKRLSKYEYFTPLNASVELGVVVPVLDTVDLLHVIVSA